MYIDSSISESEITFFLRDRYGNIAKENLTATLEKDGSNRPAISFNNGIATLPREPGLYTISVPEIASHTITYRDETGEKVFKGIPTHTRLVDATVGRYNFLPDYNALYTVLA